MDNQTLIKQIENAINARDEALRKIDEEIVSCETRVVELRDMRNRLTGKTGAHSATYINSAKTHGNLKLVLDAVSPIIKAHPDGVISMNVATKTVYTALESRLTMPSVYTYLNKLVAEGSLKRPARGMLGLPANNT